MDELRAALNRRSDASHRHGHVYDARRRELAVTVPDDAKVDERKQVLRWRGGTGAVVSSTQEVLDFAKVGDRGFALGKA